MRALLILIVVVGGPLSIVSQITSGHPDWSVVGLTAFLVLGAVGGIYVKVQQGRVAQGQRDFWLSQRRK